MDGRMVEEQEGRSGWMDPFVLLPLPFLSLFPFFPCGLSLCALSVSIPPLVGVVLLAFLPAPLRSPFVLAGRAISASSPSLPTAGVMDWWVVQ